MSPVPLMTAEELLRYQPEDMSTELLDGRMVVREPPSTFHGLLSQRLANIMADHVRAHGLGVVFGQDTGFHIRSTPDTVRAPDVAFLAQARVGEIPLTGYARMAPDLVAEIISPGDRPGEVLVKVADWLDAGVAVVWVIDPRRRAAQLFWPDGRMRVVPEDGDLTGDDVLPGFRCPLRRVLDCS